MAPPRQALTQITVKDLCQRTDTLRRVTVKRSTTASTPSTTSMPGFPRSHSAPDHQFGRMARRHRSDHDVDAPPIATRPPPPREKTIEGGRPVDGLRHSELIESHHSSASATARDVAQHFAGDRRAHGSVDALGWRSAPRSLLRACSTDDQTTRLWAVSPNNRGNSHREAAAPGPGLVPPTKPGPGAYQHNRDNQSLDA